MGSEMCIRDRACLRLNEPICHPTCDCAACKKSTAISQMVSRQLALHAMLRRLIEVEELRVVDAKDRYAYLIDLFNTACNKAAELAEALGDDDSHRISHG